jgi:hypothetical protein
MGQRPRSASNPNAAAMPPPDRREVEIAGSSQLIAIIAAIEGVIGLVVLLASLRAWMTRRRSVA